MKDSQSLHNYRLIFTEDDAGGTREVEFQDNCPDSAFGLAQRAWGVREVQIFEDERSLGRLTRSDTGNFWIVS